MYTNIVPHWQTPYDNSWTPRLGSIQKELELINSILEFGRFGKKFIELDLKDFELELN